MNPIVFVGYNINGNKWHPAAKILSETMQERGLREEAVRRVGVSSETHSQVAALNPSVVVALGDSALRLLLDEPAPPVTQCRGYVWETSLGPVLAAIDPAVVHKTWTPWRMLLSLDLLRAKKIQRSGLTRPVRNVEVLM
jgi:hypothetical protein